MNYIEQVANMLGTTLYEEFNVKPTEMGRALGYKARENTIYRFDSDIVHKGVNDGWSEWYGGDEKVLHLLLLNLFEIVKIKK